MKLSYTLANTEKHTRGNCTDVCHDETTRWGSSCVQRLFQRTENHWTEVVQQFLKYRFNAVLTLCVSSRVLSPEVVVAAAAFVFGVMVAVRWWWCCCRSSQWWYFVVDWRYKCFSPNMNFLTHGASLLLPQTNFGWVLFENRYLLHTTTSHAFDISRCCVFLSICIKVRVCGSLVGPVKQQQVVSTDVITKQRKQNQRMSY